MLMHILVKKMLDNKIPCDDYWQGFIRCLQEMLNKLSIIGGLINNNKLVPISISENHRREDVKHVDFLLKNIQQKEP